jgi:hypothetical protein
LPQALLDLKRSGWDFSPEGFFAKIDFCRKTQPPFLGLSLEKQEYEGSGGLSLPFCPAGSVGCTARDVANVIKNVLRPL